MAAVELDELTPPVGVAVRGVDLRRDLDDDWHRALRAALRAHKLLLFPDQDVYVHHWAEGDLVVWDNHAVQHARPDVGTEQHRTLRRVCVGEDQDLSLFATRARSQ